MILPRHNDDNDENLSALGQYVRLKDKTPEERLMFARKQQREKIDKQIEEQQTIKQ